MNASTKTALVTALVIVVLLSLFFGGGMLTGVMPGGGMMGYGSMDGIGWMWVPILLVVVFGARLVSFLFEKK
ncbi:MAG: hypothetical protein IPP88_17340 [Betaproteobacteria bacterium]|nr:hypothetical protein [Betaproteobacteria bacterium]